MTHDPRTYYSPTHLATYEGQHLYLITHPKGYEYTLWADTAGAAIFRCAEARGWDGPIALECIAKELE